MVIKPQHTGLEGLLGLFPAQGNNSGSFKGVDFNALLSDLVNSDAPLAEGEIQLTHGEIVFSDMPRMADSDIENCAGVSAKVIIRTADGEEVSLPVTIIASVKGKAGNTDAGEITTGEQVLFIRLDEHESLDSEMPGTVFGHQAQFIQLTAVSNAEPVTDVPSGTLPAGSNDTAIIYKTSYLAPGTAGITAVIAESSRRIQGNGEKDMPNPDGDEPVLPVLNNENSGIEIKSDSKTINTHDIGKTPVRPENTAEISPDNSDKTESAGNGNVTVHDTIQSREVTPRFLEKSIQSIKDNPQTTQEKSTLASAPQQTTQQPIVSFRTASGTIPLTFDAEPAQPAGSSAVSLISMLVSSGAEVEIVLEEGADVRTSKKSMSGYFTDSGSKTIDISASEPLSIDGGRIDASPGTADNTIRLEMPKEEISSAPKVETGAVRNHIGNDEAVAANKPEKYETNNTTPSALPVNDDAVREEESASVQNRVIRQSGGPGTVSSSTSKLGYTPLNNPSNPPDAVKKDSESQNVPLTTGNGNDMETSGQEIKTGSVPGPKTISTDIPQKTYNAGNAENAVTGDTVEASETAPFLVKHDDNVRRDSENVNSRGRNETQLKAANIAENTAPVEKPAMERLDIRQNYDIRTIEPVSVSEAGDKKSANISPVPELADTKLAGNNSELTSEGRIPIEEPAASEQQVQKVRPFNLREGFEPDIRQGSRIRFETVSASRTVEHEFVPSYMAQRVEKLNGVAEIPAADGVGKADVTVSASKQPALIQYGQAANDNSPDARPVISVADDTVESVFSKPGQGSTIGQAPETAEAEVFTVGKEVNHESAATPERKMNDQTAPAQKGNPVERPQTSQPEIRMPETALSEKSGEVYKMPEETTSVPAEKHGRIETAAKEGKVSSEIPAERAASVTGRMSEAETGFNGRFSENPNGNTANERQLQFETMSARSEKPLNDFKGLIDKTAGKEETPAGFTSAEIQNEKVWDVRNDFHRFAVSHEGAMSETELEIVNTVVRHARFMIDNGRSSADIRLEPPSLGRLKLEIVTENSKVTGRITVESQEVKELVQNSLAELKEQLGKSGLKVESFDVQVGHNSGADSWANRERNENLNMNLRRELFHDKMQSVENKPAAETEKRGRSLQSDYIDMWI